MHDDPVHGNDDARPWWLRLLDAERSALATPPAPDERGLWLAPEGVSPSIVPGWLNLRTGSVRIAGDVHADNAAWPLSDDSFDRVVLQHALEVVADFDAVLDEALRVLKPERQLLVLSIGALGWTRCRLRLVDSGAPALRVYSTRTILESLAVRGCVDLRVSRIVFDGRGAARIQTPARIWSGLCLIEARKRRELPNVRRLRPRARVRSPTGSWIARPSSRAGLAA